MRTNRLGGCAPDARLRRAPPSPPGSLALARSEALAHRRQIVDRPTRAPIGIFIGAGALALLLAACSTAKFEPAAIGHPTTPGPHAAAEAATPAAFTLGTIDLQAVNAPAELPGLARAGLQGVLDRYINTAVVVPLRSGAPAGDLASIFGGAALERMTGPDRAALVDEGLPKASLVRVTSAHADLTALIGPDGIAVVVAAIKLVVTGVVEGAPLTVERTGELLLAADGENWRVTGYDVRVSRDAAGMVTTTTVHR